MLRRALPTLSRTLLLVLAILGLHGAAVARAQQPALLVFAAASLKNALDEVDGLYEKQKGVAAKASYAASPTLAKQIEAGAPADVFISADLDWMDYLQQRNLIQPGTRKSLLGNRLVIAAPAGSDLKLDIKPGF